MEPHFQIVSNKFARPVKRNRKRISEKQENKTRIIEEQVETLKILKSKTAILASMRNSAKKRNQSGNSKLKSFKEG